MTKGHLFAPFEWVKNQINDINEELSVLDTDKVDKATVSTFMSKNNPNGIGTFAMNGTSKGTNSVALGTNCVSNGDYSLTEGYNNTTMGNYSHVEGLGNNKFEDIEEKDIISCSINLQLTATGFESLKSYNSSSDITGNGDFTYNGKSYKYYAIINDINKIFSNWDTIPQSNYYEGYVDATPSTAHPEYGLERVTEDIVLTNDNISTANSFYIFTNSTNINGSLIQPMYQSIETKISSYQTITITELDLTATHVQGKYSLVDNDYAHVVGGGISDSDRKNIHTLDWDGNAEFAGDVIATKTDGVKVSLTDVSDKISKKVDKISGKGLSTNDLTSTLKSNYDKAYEHSKSDHAPSEAEKNVVVGIQKNGTDLTVDSSTRKVNITVPTKTSELTNDSGFKTTDNDTTYSLSKSGSTITLTGSDGSTTSVTDDNTTYTPQSLGNGYGTCSTSASTTAKVVTLSNYSLVTNGRVSVKFTYAVPANATLNINSKGAKSIYHKGSAIKANVINAGDIATFVYNGSQYILTSVDNVIKASDYLLKENPSGIGTFNMNGSVSGNYSSVLGYNNTASGNYSHVEGLCNNKIDTFKPMTVVNVSVTVGEINSSSVVYDGVTYSKYAKVTLNETPSISEVSSTGYYKGKITTSDGSLTASDVLIEYASSDMINVHSTDYSLMNFTGKSSTLYFEQTEIPPSTEATHIQGKYALIDNNYAHVVGNGTSDTNRSNAHTLDWSGNAVYAGDVCATDSNGELVSLLDMASNSSSGEIPFYIGSCTTSAGTANKTVTITNFELKKGVRVHIKFSYTNTSSSSTLNISSTGAFPMYYKDGTRMYYIPEKIYHTFEYDGTYYRYLGSQNAIIGERNYERYGLKMLNSALVPVVSGYSPSIGTSDNKLSNIYATTGRFDYVYVKTNSSSVEKILPPLPLLHGHFTVPSYHSISINNTICQNYAKAFRNGYINTNSDVSSCGCASSSNTSGNNYDVALIFRVIGYDSASGKAAVPFVHEFVLSTSYQTSNCGNNTTDWYVYTTPCGNTIHFYLTGFSSDCCGYVSGSPTLNISSAGASNVHFSEIALMP